MLVRIPKDKDSTVTLKPGYDFRPEDQQLWVWPWLRPLPDYIHPEELAEEVSCTGR